MTVDWKGETLIRTTRRQAVLAVADGFDDLAKIHAAARVGVTMAACARFTGIAYPKVQELAARHGISFVDGRTMRRQQRRV